MNVTRTLVTALLISSVIMGFVQGVSTQPASGTITGMSTITSTYYSTWYGTTTSTRLATTTARTVTQGTIGAKWSGSKLKQDGPYVGFEISLGGWYEKGQTSYHRYDADGTVTNLMNVPIEKMSVVFLVYSADKKVTGLDPSRMRTLENRYLLRGVSYAS